MSENKISNTKFSIIVPVYNSEKTLDSLYKRISATMEKNKSKFEIIFVDDGSVDGSWEIIKRIAERDEKVTSIKLMRNYGQAAATMCGFGKSRGLFVITIDDDLQTPPEEITKLLNFMEEHPEIDVVFGEPIKKRHKLWRRLGSNALNWLNRRMFEVNKKVYLTSFRLLRKPIVDELLLVRTSNPAIGPMICKATPFIENVSVEHEVRAADRGHYTPGKILTLTLDKILSFSNFPLRFLAVIGLLGILSCITLGVFYFVRYLRGGIRVSGWITLVLLLISLSGFNFFAFGIFGEYLLRILQSSNQIPQYRIREIISKFED
jgi:glycosyltransferase involved in cell wall biosynthesis